MTPPRFPSTSMRIASALRCRFKHTKRSVPFVSRFRRVVYRKTRAALVLQRVWRGVFCFKSSQRVVRDFMALGLSSEYIRGESDYVVVARLMEPQVLLATKACLRYVHLFVGFPNGSPSDLNMLATVGIKPFLASLRFAFHRDVAFEHPGGAAETALFDSALALVNAFEWILRLVVECGRSAGAIRFDEGHRFGPLFLLYLQRFQEWQRIDRPRRVENIKGSLVMLQAGMAYTCCQAQVRDEIKSLRHRLLKLAGEEELRAIDAECCSLPAFRERMAKDQLAHELLLDPTFRLDTPFRKGAFGTHLSRGFWEQRQLELSRSPPLYDGVFALFEEIRLRLLRTGGFGVYEAVLSESIRAPDSALHWDGCIALVGAAIAILQRLRPGVDMGWAEIEASMRAAQPDQYARALVAAVRSVFDGVEALEGSAPTLRSTPRVVEQGVEYEREQFESKLADGSLTLERTARWMRSAIRKEVDADAVGKLGLVEGTEDAYIRVHSAAMVGLVADAAGPITGRECPETLLLDVDRLERLRLDFRQAVAAMTLSVVATRFLMEAGNLMVDRPVLLQIQAHLAEARPLDAPQNLIHDLAAMLLRSSLADDARALCVRTVFASLGGEDSMHALMARRARDIWLRVLTGEGAGPATSATSASLVARIEGAAATLHAVAKLNRAVHVLHYKEMLVETAREMLVEVAGTFSSSSVSSSLHESA